MKRFFPLPVVGLWAWFVLALGSHPAEAAGVAVRNLRLVDSLHLACELRWDDAWRLPADQQPANHDALWCFAKIDRGDGTGFDHLRFSRQAGAHQAAGDTLEALPAVDGVGCWVRRRRPGHGPIGWTAVRLRLASPLSRQRINGISLHALQMVWVPPAAFWVGDGKSLFALGEATQNTPYRIASEAAIATDSAAGNLNSREDYPPAGPVPNAFPKGYAGFYAMRYELSQLQYAIFLNSLSYQGQSRRMEVSPGGAAGKAIFMQGDRFRNGLVLRRPGRPGTPSRIDIDLNGNGQYQEGIDGRHRAASYLNWADLSAYLDWAGLRPMSELEFEKACRGPRDPVAGGFAHGTAQTVDANALARDGTPEERHAETLPPRHGIVAHGYTGPQGPLRTGFAAGDTTSRLSAGASYYGLMEMSGNLWEQVVNVSTSPGLRFEGSNGDGQLTAGGEADPADWPSTDGSGAGHRGGAWNSGLVDPYRDPAVSDRFYINLKPEQRRNTTGGRGVRSGGPGGPEPDSVVSGQELSPWPFRGGAGGGYAFARWSPTSDQGESISGLAELRVWVQQQVLRLSTEGRPLHGQIQVVDALGRLQARRRLHGQTQARLSLARLAPGLYFWCWLDARGGTRQGTFYY